MPRLRSIGLVVLLAAVTTVCAGAAPFAIVTNNHDRTLHVLDLGTSPPTLSGPFFTGGELGGSATTILDVAVTPDGHWALVSNFAGDTVYRIDLSNPTAPVVAGSVGLPFSAEDLAVAPDGSYALVTGGSGENRLSVLTIEPFALETTYTLITPGATASCVAIGADSRTVVLCDPANDQILSVVVDPGVGASLETAHATGSFPVNATFSPNGQTVLVADGGDGAVTVFEVTAPGTLVPGTTPSVGSGLPGNQQSIAFSPGGSEAYVLSEGSSPDQLSVLDVLGPGNVTLAMSGAADLLGDASGAIRLGVDALAVAPAGDRLLATNPGGNGSPSADVSVVDLSTFGVTAAPTGSDGPTAVDVFAPFVGAPPPAPKEVPTLAGSGLLALSLLLAVAALLALRPGPG